MRGKDKPFITTNTKDAIRKKHTAWRNFKMSNSESDLADYKVLNKEVQKLVTQERMD